MPPSLERLLIKTTQGDRLATTTRQPRHAYLIHPDPEVRERCRDVLAKANIAVSVFASTDELRAMTPPSFDRDTLTRREQQVLDAIMVGKSNRDIAMTLGISTKTVELHRANLMAKLHAHNVVDLIRVVLEKV